MAVLATAVVARVLRNALDAVNVPTELTRVAINPLPILLANVVVLVATEVIRPLPI